MNGSGDENGRNMTVRWQGGKKIKKRPLLAVLKDKSLFRQCTWTCETRRPKSRSLYLSLRPSRQLRQRR